jgi:hypothetical protein
MTIIATPHSEFGKVDGHCVGVFFSYYHTTTQLVRVYASALFAPHMYFYFRLRCHRSRHVIIVFLRLFAKVFAAMIKK